MAKKVIMVVAMQMKRNCQRIPLKTSIYAMIETVDGMNRSVIFFNKNSERSSICSVFMSPEIKHKNKRTRAITLPGKGIGRKSEIMSPRQHKINSVIICLKIFIAISFGYFSKIVYHT